MIILVIEFMISNWYILTRCKIIIHVDVLPWYFFLSVIKGSSSSRSVADEKCRVCSTIYKRYK